MSEIPDAMREQWSQTFSAHDYFYGDEPGPVARRAVRYHRPTRPTGGTALDAGCGEGQDLAFLAERGYDALGLDFASPGASKARRLLQARGLTAQVEEADLRDYAFETSFDLVLAVNTLQFLGSDASQCLERVIACVAPGGVLGLSLFAREAWREAVMDGVFYVTMSELLGRFHRDGEPRGWQMLEAAQLWQWNARADEPQAFITLIARRLPNF